MAMKFMCYSLQDVANVLYPIGIFVTPNHRRLLDVFLDRRPCLKMDRSVAEPM